MYKIVYDVDYSQLRDIINYIENVLQEASSLKQSIKHAGVYAIQEWIKTANAKFTHEGGGYVQGIHDGIKYPFLDDPLHFRIVHQSKYARALEDGYDMKQNLHTSNKVRISKEGKVYLIIPFRHGTPGTVGIKPMPIDVYQNESWYDKSGSQHFGAKSLRASVVSGVKEKGSLRYTIGADNLDPKKQPLTKDDIKLLEKKNPMTVLRNEYKWGDRLTGLDYPLEKPHHKTSIYEGMVRFQTNPSINRETLSTGKFVNRGYMGSSSSYMTFRIMTAEQQGWVIKPMKILAETVERIKQPIMQMLAEGAKKDLGRVFNKPY
jgi:hypothetical protein